MDLDALLCDISELSQGDSSKVKVQLRSERLTLYRENYIQLRNEMIVLVPDEEIEQELRSWKKLLPQIDKAVDAAYEYLSKEHKMDDQGSANSNDKSQPSNLTLPRIELPKFNGDVLTFQTFWDQFEAAVHNNDNLPNVQKFTYLRSGLSGNAQQVVEGFEVTGANYQPAVECLKHRYGRKRVIISSIVRSITKMDAKSTVSASSLRDLYGCILLPIFESKLPAQLLEKWELELVDTPEDEIDLELFFKFLNRQVVSKEGGERGLHTNSSPTSRSSNVRDE